MAFALPSNYAPGRSKQQTASLMTSEQRVPSYMKYDKARNFGVPEGMPLQIPSIAASAWLSGPLTERRSATLASPPYLAVRMATQLGTS
eukprot:4300957-Pleurochrysis_carterae.AAC.1